MIPVHQRSEDPAGNEIQSESGALNVKKLLLFFLLHGFYGLRVILIDVGVIREEKFFWRTLALAMGIFAFAVWFVYIREY